MSLPQQLVAGVVVASLEGRRMVLESPIVDREERRWYLVDADGLVLGRLSSEVAKLLRGKHKPNFAYHDDRGDHVIVVNAAKVAVTSDKASRKFWWRHSGYPGGLRSASYSQLLASKPEEVVRRAVRGMLPKGRLGRRMLGKLRVYAGPSHPHGAQQPQRLELTAAKRTISAR